MIIPSLRRQIGIHESAVLTINVESDCGRKHTVRQHSAIQFDLGGKYPVNW